MALAAGDLAAKSDTSASKTDVSSSTAIAVGVDGDRWRVWYDFGGDNAYVAYESNDRRQKTVRVSVAANVWIENTGDESIHWEIYY